MHLDHLSHFSLDHVSPTSKLRIALPLNYSLLTHSSVNFWIKTGKLHNSYKHWEWSVFSQRVTHKHISNFELVRTTANLKQIPYSIYLHQYGNQFITAISFVL